MDYPQSDERGDPRRPCPSDVPQLLTGRAAIAASPIARDQWAADTLVCSPGAAAANLADFTKR